MKKKRRDDHDPKTCFRCRLHDLWKELSKHEWNSQRFMLIAMAEACGDILAQMDQQELILFMFAVQKFMYESEESETRH